jgi:CheY-like chemotaxis protein
MSVSVANGLHALVVLVVEDEFLVRHNIASYLREAGHVVVEAKSGEDAIALCNSGQQVDMAFTDINLGGAASGWDVANWFRRVRPNGPVVYTSGKTLDSAACVSGSVFLSKPYRNDDVLDICQQLVADGTPKPKSGL